jgi:hypothetical protein
MYQRTSEQLTLRAIAGLPQQTGLSVCDSKLATLHHRPTLGVPSEVADPNQQSPNCHMRDRIVRSIFHVAKNGFLVGLIVSLHGAEL